MLRTINFMAQLVAGVIIVAMLIPLLFEIFSFIVDYENFVDTAKLASKTALNQATQAGIAKANNMTDADYYQQKLSAANGAYGLAQVQDGFVVADPNELDGYYAGVQVPREQSYSYNLQLNMVDLISKISTDRRYTAADLGITSDSDIGDDTNEHFKREQVATLNKDSQYTNGNTSIAYRITMTYKPRFAATKFLLPMLNGNFQLQALVQPITYIEP